MHGLSQTISIHRTNYEMCFTFFHSYKKATSASKLMPAKSAVAFCYNIQLLKQKQNGVDINKGDVHIFSLPSLFQGYLSVRGATRLKYLLSWKQKMFILKDNAARKTMGLWLKTQLWNFWGLSRVVRGFWVAYARGLSFVMWVAFANVMLKMRDSVRGCIHSHISGHLERLLK